ncbi:MAG: ATP-binding protein [Flavobacteriales bacterium]
MHFFNRINLRQKLLLATLFPLTIVCWFSVDKILAEIEEKDKLEIIGTRAHELKLISHLVHEFQKERDYSVLYINNATFEMQLKLREQVKQTDSLVRAIKIVIQREQLDTSFYPEITAIQKVRGNVEAFVYTYEEADEYFSTYIEKMIDRIAAIATATRTEKTNDPIRAYISLINTKESLGRMRTTVNKAFDMHVFDGLDYGKFAGQKGAFESNLKSFIKLASPTLSDNFQRDFSQGSVAKMLEMTSYVFAHPTEKLFAYSSEDWWFSTTSALNIVYAVESLSLSEIDKIVNDDINSANDAINSSIAIVIVTVLMVILLVSFSIRSVDSQMRRLSLAAKKIEDGNTEIDLKVYTHDSIGDLTKAFLSLAENTNDLAEVANKIGQGNYDVPVKIRGPHDVLGQSIVNMQQSLKNATKELNDLVEELKLSNKYKSEFLANMSHELRTPLNSMLILSKLLMDNSDGNLTGDQVDSAQVINKSGNSLLRLINDILDLSKIEAGKLDVEMAEVSVNEVLNDVHNLFKPLAAEKKINLEFQNVIADKVFHSDKHRLEQILKNIISNAIKFTPVGGRLSVGARYRDNAIAFEITDTGIGIPASKQAQVFEAFKQADGSISRQYGGTGLGLSITKNLVNLLGGEIVFKSEEGKGTTFTVLFPLELISLQENIVLEEAVVPVQKRAEWIKLENAVLSQYAKMLRGRKLHFFSKDIMHVYQLNALFEKYNCNLVELSDIAELKDITALKDFTLLIVENTDLLDQESAALKAVDKSLWLDESMTTEKELLERIKNILVNV